LFLFGKTIAGQRCWYAIGSFTIQPSEFAKSATSLALAKYLSDSQINLKKPIVKYRFLQLCFLQSFLSYRNPILECVNIQCFFIVLYREAACMVHLDWFHYHFSYAILIVRATIRDTNCLTSHYCPFQIKVIAQEYCIKRYLP
jgi:cell division protein FtsW (lipid II flippase)